jgi:hypothetical protein
MKINLYYNDFKKEIDIDISKKIGIIQENLLNYCSLLIYNIEYSEIIIDNKNYILGDEEFDFNKTFEKILVDLFKEPFNIEKIIINDRKRDFNGNVIKDNIIINKYNKWYQDFENENYINYINEYDNIYREQNENRNIIRFPLTNILQNILRVPINNLSNINIVNNEQYNQEIYNEEIDNEEIDNEEIDNEEIDNEEIDNEEIDNEEIDNEEIDNEEIDNEEIDNEEIDNEEIDNEEIDNEELNNEDIDNEEIDNEEIDNEELNNEEIDNEEINNEEINNEEIDNEKIDNEEIDNEEIDNEEIDNEEIDNEEINNVQVNNEEVNIENINILNNINSDLNSFINIFDMYLRNNEQNIMQSTYINILENSIHNNFNNLNNLNNFNNLINIENDYSDLPDLIPFNENNENFNQYNLFTLNNNNIFPENNLNYSNSYINYYNINHEDVKIVLNEEQFNNIESLLYKDLNIVESMQCLICTEEFVESDNIKKIKCNHLFHCECIKPWLCEESNKCPVCRIDIDKGIQK